MSGGGVEAISIYVGSGFEGRDFRERGAYLKEQTEWHAAIKGVVVEEGV